MQMIGSGIRVKLKLYTLRFLLVLLLPDFSTRLSNPLKVCLFERLTVGSIVHAGIS